MPGAEICVSYAWSDDTPEGRDRAAVVDDLCAEAARRNIRILRDKDVLGLGERISKFMRHIGRADRVFVILSDKYLKSPACMFELCEIWRNSRLDDDDFLSRIRVYTLDCAKIWTVEERTDYAINWKQRHDALEARVREHGYNILGRKDMEELRLMDTFRGSVGDILATVADVLQPRSFDDLVRYGLNDILGIRPQSTNASDPAAHKHTGSLGVPASEVDGVAGGDQHQGEQDESRRQENEKRLQKLKTEIGQVLSRSNVAMNELQNSAASQGWERVEGYREQESSFVDWLMNAQFYVVKDALLEAYENLKVRQSGEGSGAIEKVSRFLLPWLYVSGTPIDTSWWNDRESLKNIVELPCGLETFTEIVLAGLERREVIWDDDNPEKWPLWPDGEHRVQIPPEAGITPRVVTSLCDELWRIVHPPPQGRNRDFQLKKTLIQNQLKDMEERRGLRPYWIVSIPEDEPDRSIYDNALKEIREWFPQIVCIKIDESLLAKDQDLFNEIRHLLVPGSL